MDTSKKQRKNDVKKSKTPADRIESWLTSKYHRKLVLISSTVIAILSNLTAVSLVTLNHVSSVKEDLSDLQEDLSTSKGSSLFANMTHRLDHLETELSNATHGNNDPISQLEMRLTNLTNTTDGNLDYFSVGIQKTDQRLEHSVHHLQGNACHHEEIGKKFEGYDYIVNPYVRTCIWLVTEHVDWQTAKKGCESRGAKLAVLPTIEEVNWFEKYQHNPRTNSDWRRRPWIGLRDSNGWRWEGRVEDTVSANDIIWQKQPHQPHLSYGKPCGFMHENRPKIWDDHCSIADGHYYLCEEVWI